MRQQLIEIRPDVANGKPVLKGARVTVQSGLELLAAGDGIDEELNAFPV
jgi:uncharacterized protein (DUF433 family)